MGALSIERVFRRPERMNACRERERWTEGREEQEQYEAL